MLPKFFASVAPLVGKGKVSVDIGAGDGWYAGQLAANGAVVTAVERHPPPEIPKGVDWKTDTIEHWLGTLSPDFRADMYLMKNVLQFFDKKWIVDVFLPQLASRLNSGGVIAIETFYDQPVPAFLRPHQSYYSAAELAGLFPGWQILRNDEAEEAIEDLRGKMRTFRYARLIARKPVS